MTSERQNELRPLSEEIPWEDDNPFKLDPLTLQQLSIRSNESLPSIIENDTRTSLSNDIQKEFDRTSQSLYSIDLSSLRDANQLPVSSLLEETNQSSSDTPFSAITNSINRKISLSESDLLASLHRNADNQSDYDTTDDLLFLEWDKERNLFQDYINSLRKEIRVLLQERLEHQTQTHTEYKHFNDEQTKIDLLQKSLEEKNFVFEQLQTEYELIKEKNTNLTSKISRLQSDGKSQINTIDEFKQKLADLTVDIQNHVLVKRRLEISIKNLETDCNIIDTERIRLTSDIKENQHHKQELEKLLQKANVQIAEQGSTIEMLRSENVQVRSQLSTIQRRMFQEKQQIMDYLRQIENDLIEKEQIKQRELSLRQDYEQLQLINKQDRKEIEQLKNSINHDRQKLEQLQQESSQLLKTIQTKDDDLDTYKSATKRLYSHFQIPFDSIQSMDQLIPILEDRYHSQQIPEHDQLRRDLENMTVQCKQLNEANQAWQQFQQAQLDSFRNKLQNHIPLDNHFSFDEIAQRILDHLNQTTNQPDALLQTSHNLNNELQTIEKQSPDTHLEPSSSSDDVHIHTLTNEELRENLSNLTAQCAQLDEANRAWQQYQQTQLDHFRNTLEDYLPFDKSVSLDQVAQLVVDQINKEREDFNELYEALEKANNDLRSESTNVMESVRESYLNTIKELNQELLAVQEQCKEFHRINKQLLIEKEKLNNEFNDRSIVIGHQLELSSNDLEQESEKSQLQSTSSPDKNKPETVDKYTEYEPIEQRQTQIDQEIQTELLHQLWSTSDAEDPRNSNEDNDRLNEYIDEISSLSSIDLSNRLHEECEQIISKQNLKLTSIPNIELNQLALIVLYSLYNQHLTDEAKQLYNETVIRALKQEYELINTEKDDLMEQLSVLQEKSQQELNNLQLKYDELLERERLDCKQTIKDLVEKYENQLQLNLDSSNEHINKLKEEKNDEELEREYNQLRRDFDTINNEYELLKDYNSQMYQKKLQGAQNNDSIEIKSSDIQHDFSDEVRTYNSEEANWNDQISPLEQPNLSSMVAENVIKQTVDQPQVNNELKHSLQTIKDKVHRVVVERPELFLNSSDDTIERLDHLIDAIGSQATKIDLLKTVSVVSASTLSEKEIEQLMQERNQAQEEQLKAQEEINNFKSQLVERDNLLERIKQLEDVINEFHVDQEEKQLQKAKNSVDKEPTISSSRPNQTIDNETQTDDQKQDKLVQINTKLKRALQTIKEKVHRVVAERPELFPDTSDDTIERLDCLISVIENQATQIDVLQNKLDHAEYEINELQNSLEAYQSQIDNERALKTEQHLSEASLRERLNEVELELRKTLDDHSSTMTKYESLVQQQTLWAAESQNEIQQLKEELDELKLSLTTQSDEDIKSLQEVIEQQSEQLKDLNGKNLTLSSQVEVDRQKKETETRVHVYANQIESLMEERAELLEEIQKNAVSSVQRIDNESQTDDHQHEKLVQVNNKLKRVLQTFKDKIHRVVIERPDLFVDVGEETSERLDHLISTVNNQVIQVDALQAERDQAEEQLQHEIKELQSSLEATQYELENERRVKIEQPVSASPPSEDNSSSIIADYETQLRPLQRNLSQNNEERALLRERLNEVELELRKTLDDLSSAMSKCESMAQDRDALIEQKAFYVAESQHEIEQLKEELDELKQSLTTQTDEHGKSLQEAIEQLKDLNEKNLALISQAELNDRQKKEAEARLKDFENLLEERDNLLKEIQENASSSVQTTDNESQTDDRQHEKLVQLNNKLKRALQTFKDKIHRIVTERPDLFVDIGEETSERFDHLISTVENQAKQLGVLEVERTLAEEQLRGNIKELENSLETCKNELDNERRLKIEQLVSTALPFTSPEPVNPSIIEDYETQLVQLQQNLSEKDDEGALLRERLNEVELELRKAVDDQALTTTKYESLAEQHTLRSKETQQEIEQLKKDNDQIQEDLTELKNTEIQKDEKINMLYEMIEQQSEQLNEKCLTLSSEVDRQRKEAEARLRDYENLIEERDNLLEEVQNNALSSVQRTDNESQTDDHQHEKLVQVNNKLKRALQTFKDKIHRLVTERPDLFVNVGEETSEHLDHLISTVNNQAIQVDVLQAERDQAEEQLRHEIKELQSSLEATQYELDNERRVKIEQLVSTAPSSPPPEDNSSSIIADYETQLRQLQRNLSQNNEERALLRERLNEVELELRKTLDDHSSSMTKCESLAQERDALVEQQEFNAAESQHEIEQLKEELDELKLSLTTQSDEDIKSLQEVIEQQSEQLKDLKEKNLALSSQVEVDRQRKETEARVHVYANQIESLMEERAELLEEIQKNSLLSVQRIDNETQTDDHQHEKLVQVNNKLKRALETLKDKIHQVVIERPDLFVNVGEETSERLDHLISTGNNQAIQVDVLQAERDQADERFRHTVSELEKSFDVYREQIDNEYRIKLDEYVLSSSSITHEIETQTIDAPIIDEQHLDTTDNQTTQETESDDNESNDWFDASPDITEKEVAEHRDIDIQCESLVENHQPSQNSSAVVIDQEPFATDASSLSEENPSLPLPSVETRTIKDKIQEMISNHPTLFPAPTNNTLEDLDQIISIIKILQDDINELQSYRNEIENERLIQISRKPNDVSTQTLGLSIVEEHQKQIEKLHESAYVYQGEIERLTDERDQARASLSQWEDEESKKRSDLKFSYEQQLAQLQQQEENSSRSLNSIESQTSLEVESLAESRLSEYQCQIDVLLRERMSLMEQIQQITSSPTKENIETQTIDDTDLLPSSSDQGISRRVFEQEMLSWSKESEQLKQFVKQFQTENKKLKDIILKFERMALDYMHENERLKQENQHLSFINYSSKQKINETGNFTSSDKDVCYLTLKWLTYEVAQRTSNHNEQSLLVINDTERDLKRRVDDTERQFKNTRVQNERLKKQLETYTIQFKHIQHEMNIQIQEMSRLKDETERLRTNETQYRLEIDRLKADLQDDQLKFRQLEREFLDAKLQRSSNDNTSIDNLRELLELKERELNALKEKLDYTKKAHQLELQEAMKTNQFSLDNVKLYQQADLRHQEKRRELETRLGKFCTISKPIIDNQQLFSENPIINIDELRKLLAETETEERITTSLSPIRDCLSLLEAQMKDLHHNIIENHARRSKRWKYKLGFECLSCESRWEVIHDVRDLQEACLDPSRFLESSVVEPMAGCSCPIMIDFVESDVHLCLDDIINDVIVRTTVK